jgi:hypothetical protein
MCFGIVIFYLFLVWLYKEQDLPALEVFKGEKREVRLPFLDIPTYKSIVIDCYEFLIAQISGDGRLQ